jgi:2-polyprenyl-3-methyl-5-hydroxy-6-metoxy-1,4-benzoquinol methylase
MLSSVKDHLRFPCPASLIARRREIDETGLAAVRGAIQTHYHRGWRARESYTPEGYAQDLQQHLTGRLSQDRRLIVPWLNSVRPLQGSRLLEIGCGTGSSTVAMAEQGAEVVGVDIDTDALEVARIRLEAHALKAELVSENITTFDFAGRRFDVAIFFACLEHMTLSERLRGLANVWRQLPAGGLLVVVDTPNRLWFYDQHTSWLHFFHWLPDELAFQYSKRSPRALFRDSYHEETAEKMLHFRRQGRGVSFHEFDIAIGPVETLPVVSSLCAYRGWRRSIGMSRQERRYKAVLRSARPDLHQGWFDAGLDIAIEKR